MLRLQCVRRLPTRTTATLISHQLTACRQFTGPQTKKKGSKPKRAVYHTPTERATWKSNLLLYETSGKPFLQHQFNEARSNLAYLRRRKNSNKRTVHAALNVLDRLTREIYEQEQMSRSDFLTFEYVEPFLLNWVRAWREEHDRGQNIYKPMDLLKKLQAVPWPEHFDPDQKMAATILAGTLEMAHKFDAPELGEEMLLSIKTVTLEHCNMVLRAWAVSNLWNGADAIGLKSFCCKMVKVHGQLPNAESFEILESFLGKEEALSAFELAIADRPDAVAILARAGHIDRAESRFIEVVAKDGPIYECARTILDSHEGNIERAEKFYHEIMEFLNDEDHDILLERLVDFYALEGDYIKAEEAMIYTRFDRPYASLIAALKDQPDRIVTLVRENYHNSAVVEAAMETLSKQLHVKQAMQILRILDVAPVRLLNTLLGIISASQSEEAGMFAFQVLQEAKGFMSTDKQSFHETLRSCLQSGLLNEADTISSQCLKYITLEEAKDLLDCWKFSGTRESAQRTREQIERIENPNIFTYNVLLHSIVMSANPITGKLLFDVYEEILKSEREPDDLTYDIILGFCFQSGLTKDVELGEQIFGDLQKKPKHHYEANIIGWLRVKETKRARDAFFRQVEDYVNKKGHGDIRPSQELVSAITRQFIRHKRILKAHHFVEDVNDLWLTEYLPDPPDNQGTIRPLLDAWGMSSFVGKDLYINDILNCFADFSEEGIGQKEPENPFRAPGDDPHGYDEPLFYQMEGLSDEEDKIDFPEAVDPDGDQFGDVHVDPASVPEEKEEEDPDWVLRRRGYWGNMPDSAFVDSSDDEDNIALDSTKSDPAETS